VKLLRHLPVLFVAVLCCAVLCCPTDDDYVRSLALFLANNLRPDVKIHVEHSNEVWNQAFAQVGNSPHPPPPGTLNKCTLTKDKQPLH
jgi:hypothetical protein